MSPNELLDLAASIAEQWSCWCPDSHLRSHCYIDECPRHTLGPKLIEALTEAAREPNPTLADSARDHASHRCPRCGSWSRDPGKTCIGPHWLRHPAVTPMVAREQHTGPTSVTEYESQEGATA